MKDNAGDSGRLLVEAEQIFIKDGALIFSTTHGKGQSGSITLHASNIGITGTNKTGGGSNIRVSVHDESNGGDGGLIKIETQALLLADGGVILGLAHGPGKGSDITIHATGTITVIGADAKGESSGIDSSSNPKLGPGGKLEPSRTLIAGPAGDITLDVKKLILGEGGRISSSSFTTVKPFKSSQGGDIFIRAESIEMVGVNPYGENVEG